MEKIKIKKFLYGGDYNPDQWPEEVWKEDIEYMKYLNVNAVSMPIFSWAKLEPEEGKFNFDWLDKIINDLYKNGINVVLATPTASQPAWLSKKYPDVLPVDIEGRKRKHGARQNYCPNSPNFKKAVQRIVEAMANHYKDCEAVILWHISNEYGPYCYCDNCKKEFQNWLKNRYKTIDELNRRWNTNFWGHTFYDWDEIEVPSILNEQFYHYPGKLASSFQGLTLDYKRFMSDSLINLFIMEKEIIKKYTPNTPVTTNLMETYKPIDYQKLAKYMDVNSWDCYPSLEHKAYNVAFRHELIRGLKKDEPFLLMEQSPSQTNWKYYNSLKRPKTVRLLSYEAIAHGADSVMFFQWRQSIGSCEKFHSAMVPHAGHLNTRIGRELKQIGDELTQLDSILDSVIKGEAAVLFDWENWWAIEDNMGYNNDFKYIPHVEMLYQSLHNLNIPIDIISPNEDLSQYKLVVAPTLYMLDEEKAKNIEKFVANGGIFITTYLSGLVDENDRVILGGYPGWFRKLLGIWIEETDTLYPDMKNSIIFKEALGNISGEYECDYLCDVIHLEGAKPLAFYGKDFYKDTPCITENSFEKGLAVYIGTRPEQKLLDLIVGYYVKKAGLKSILNVPMGVEVTKRVKENKQFIFVLNHNDSEVIINLPEKYNELISKKTLEGRITLGPKEVLILEK